MTRSAARSPAAQRAMAAAICASVALSAGESVVIGYRPGSILRKGPLQANVIADYRGCGCLDAARSTFFYAPPGIRLTPWPVSRVVAIGRQRFQGRECHDNPYYSGCFGSLVDRSDGGPGRR